MSREEIDVKVLAIKEPIEVKWNKMTFGQPLLGPNDDTTDNSSMMHDNDNSASFDDFDLLEMLRLICSC